MTQSEILSGVALIYTIVNKKKTLSRNRKSKFGWHAALQVNYQIWGRKIFLCQISMYKTYLTKILWYVPFFFVNFETANWGKEEKCFERILFLVLQHKNLLREC